MQLLPPAAMPAQPATSFNAKFVSVNNSKVRSLYLFPCFEFDKIHTFFFFFFPHPALNSDSNSPLAALLVIWASVTERRRVKVWGEEVAGREGEVARCLEEE